MHAVILEIESGYRFGFKVVRFKNVLRCDGLLGKQEKVGKQTRQQ